MDGNRSNHLPLIIIAYLIGKHCRKASALLLHGGSQVEANFAARYAIISMAQFY